MRYATLFLLSAVFIMAQSWADRAEYDLALAVRAQSEPAARLKVLEEWKNKYPNSQMRHARAELVVAAAQAVGDTKTMLQAASEMVTADPNSFPGLFWVTVLQPGSGATDAESYTKTVAAAKRLLDLTPTFFASAASGQRGEAALAERTRCESLARRTMGWALWQQGNMTGAEKELRSSIELDTTSATASAWLGAVLAAQNVPERQSEAIWHLARAAFLDGEGALPPAQRAGVRQLLNAVYASYHGSAEGLAELGQKVRSRALPPAGFKVETLGEATQRQQDEELSQVSPGLLDWVKLRRRLLAPDGEAQFQAMNGTAIPRLTGFVIRCNAVSRVTEVWLGLSGLAVEEVLVKLDSPLPQCAEPGTRVQFEGVPIAFTREPFLVTVSAKRDTIEGWPAGERKR